MFGLGVRAVLVIGSACLALLAGCGGGDTTTPETRTVTVISRISSTVTEMPGVSPTSTTPRAKVFDEAAVQDSVKKILTENYQIDGVKDVTCPARQEVKEGSTFDCAVAVGDSVKKVTITVTSGEGDYQVGALGP